MILMFGLKPPKVPKSGDDFYPEIFEGRPMSEDGLVEMAYYMLENDEIIDDLTVWTESTVFLMACRAAKKANPSKYLAIRFQVEGEIYLEEVNADGRMNRDVPSVMDDLLSKLL